MASLQIVVSGSVQGVGFRAYVVHQAMIRGVCGEVWNRGDGAVEMIAAHQDEGMLDGFVQSLHSGPGRVERISTAPTAVQRSYSGFSVGASRP